MQSDLDIHSGQQGLNCYYLFTKWQNFRPVQVDGICRRQNKCDSKIEICFGKNIKQRFLPFPISFKKGFSLRVVKTQDCMINGKGLTHYHTMPHFEALKIYGCGKNCEKSRNCL